MNALSTEEKIKLINEVGEEVIGEDELAPLIEAGEQLIAYDGMEPSGQLHLAQGIFRAINTNKLTKAGVKFKFYVADWFAYLNNKVGGDMEKIQTVGKYFIEVWRAVGMDLENVEFVWASDLIKEDEYWELVMRVAKTTSLKRVIRTSQIMGRSESEVMSASQIFYPCMQAADIFMLKANITQLGMDQRKVNMLAREVGEQLGFWKPVVVSNRMLMGLGKPPAGDMDPVDRAIATKMSKSNPDSAIFMNDTREDLERKINKAYCPEGETKDNPILEYCQYMIFEAHNLVGQEELLVGGFQIKRDEKFGGDVTYLTYEELEKDFAEKNLFPLDLKNAVVEYLDKLLEPVRNHFIQDEEAGALLKEVQSYEVTR